MEGKTTETLKGQELVTHKLIVYQKEMDFRSAEVETLLCSP